MMILARREHALDVSVQCLHYANPRHHRWAARGRRDQDQGLDRSLPQATYNPGEQPETVQALQGFPIHAGAASI
jgi:hypothetical protein